MDRVMAYVDGFNLYFGLREKYGRRYHWLDLQALVTSLLKPDQDLVGVTYFTARVRNQPVSEQRQVEYLSALTAHCSKLTIVEGRYQEKGHACRRCGSTWTAYEEKETDVSVAIALLEDAVNDAFDHALVVSADSDLCPAVRAVKRVAPQKRVIAAFPPRRRSAELGNVAHARLTIGDAKIRQAQLPASVESEQAGLTFTRPTYWH